MTLHPIDAALADPAALAGLRREAFDTLTPLYRPTGIVVVGASARPEKLGYRIIKNLVDYGFAGPLYGINPQGGEVLGVPLLRRVEDLPEGIDRAIVAVAAAQVPDTLRALAARGVRLAHVYSAGFGEWDEAGQALDAELAAAVRDTGIRVVGPNCIGTFSAAGGLSATAARFAPRGPGRIAFVSQSGTHALDVIRRAHAWGLPLASSVSCGSCTDVGPADFLLHAAEAPDIALTGLYLERLDEPERLFALIRALGKPVVLLKGGRTAAGHRMTRFHTGAPVDEPERWLALARDVGVPVVESIDELMDVLLGFAAFGTVRGPRVGLFGSGGGVAVTGADAAAAFGLELPPLSAATRATLARFSVPGTIVQNPIDIPVWGLKDGDAFIVHEVIETLVAGGQADSLIAYVEMGSIFDFADDDAQGLAQVEGFAASVLQARRGGLPLSLVVRPSGDETQDAVVRTLRRRLLDHGIAVFASTRRALRTHAHLARIGGGG